MKLRLPFGFLLAGLMVGGCMNHRPVPAQSVGAPAAPAKANTDNHSPIVTPDNSISARVVRYNSVGRFVVLNCPIGQMPAAGQTLFLYRAGVKVGQIKITGPQRDNDTVGDLTDGDAQEGDDVRAQ